MSMIDDYKRLREQVVEQVELFERHQKALHISGNDGVARSSGLILALNDIVKTKAFHTLFVAEMNAKLERAFQAAKREAESFGLTMPATVESLKLEQVRAEKMPIVVTDSGVFP